MRHASHHPRLGHAPPLHQLVRGAVRVRVPPARLHLDQLALLERALDGGRAAAGEVVEAGGAHFGGVGFGWEGKDEGGKQRGSGGFGDG
jgi:hypothetical protein